MSSPARRRYHRGVLFCSAGYALSLFGAEAYFKNHPGSTSIVAYVAALVPALLIVEMFVLIGRYLAHEQDEYQRLLMVRQSLVASGIAMSAATLWGFLESFALAPHIDAYWIAVVWFGGLGIGALVNKMSIGGRA